MIVITLAACARTQPQVEAAPGEPATDDVVVTYYYLNF